MDNRGFIRDKLDLKLLILFVLRRLPRPIDVTALSELVLCDDAINYFDYVQALSELVRSEHVLCLQGDRYIITPKGQDNLAQFDDRLPYTVRLKASQASDKAAREMQREAMINTCHETRPDGSCTVSLRLSDGLGSILTMELLSGSEAQADKMERRFHKDAEALYARIAQLLLE